MNEPLLALSTAAKDPTPAGATVTIDGAPYRLRSVSTLSVAQRLRYPELRQRVGTLHKAISAGEASSEQDAEFKTLLAEMAVMAVDAPADLVRGLGFEDHLAVVAVVFFGLRPGVETPPPAARPKRRRTSRGAKSSRG